MTALLFTFIIAVIAYIITQLYSTFSYWHKRGVPHERPLPIVGNMKGVGRSLHIRDITARIYRRFRKEHPIAGIYMFFSKNVLLLDLDLIKNVLIKDFSNFHDRNTFSNTRDEPLSGHLFALKGQQWTSMRHRLSPTFTSGKMKYMFNTMTAVSGNLEKTCDQLVKADPNHIIELKELSAKFTTDVIGTCAFGIECNSLQNPEAEFRNHGRDIFEKPRHSQLVQAFVFTNPKLAQKLRMKLLSDHVSSFFMNAVKNTVEYRVKNGIKRNDFMDLLIEMMAEDQEKAKMGNGVDLSNGLTLEQMAAQAFVFFIAGFDTSSTTMSFGIYELAVNPQIQDKLREEIQTVLKEHNNEVTYEAVMSMKYLDQVFSETLRKYPVVSALIRETIDDYKVPNTNHVIPAGCTALVPIYGIHHDPELYPDPEKFDPSRFDEQSIKERHSCAYLPFGEGPRNCIGLRFGKLQTKIGIIALIRSFKFSTTDKTEIPIRLSKRNILISAENGIYLRVERI